jgi:outer membrane receptor protein involved in Fe transport
MSRISSLCRSALLCWFVFGVFTAQQAEARQDRFDVSGAVVDSAGVGLQGATVVVLTAADSTLTKFATANAEGGFTLRRVPEGEYILQITFVGFRTIQHNFSVAGADAALGMFTMEIQTEELDELVVSAEHIPMVVKKDTLEYNAAAFATRPNAVVEDLLRRLPGIEVASDGSIKAQGEDVQKVLVDGKEFFGNDPKIATKNLPADAVAKVQVYDKKSDAAEFTGVDDGQEEKTINLELKEDAKQGYFGNMSGGYSADGRYDGQASINRFSGSTQLAFIGNLNNINRQGFSFSDYISFMGGMGAMMGGGGIAFGGNGIQVGNNLSDGFSETLAAGLNLSHEFGSKFDVQSSYFLSTIENNQVRSVQSQQVLGSSLSASSAENSTQLSDNLTHRLNLNAKYEFNKGHDVRLRSNFSLSNSKLSNFGVRSTSDLSGIVQNTSDTRYLTDGKSTGGTGSLTWRKRLNEKGTSLVADYRANLNDSDTDADLESLTGIAGGGNVLTYEEIQQIQSSLGNTLQQTQRLSLSQSFGGNNHLIEVQGERQSINEDKDQVVYDLVSGAQIRNNLLSSGLDRTYTYYRGGATYRRNWETVNLGIGVEVQESTLEGTILERDVNISNGYTHILPNMNLRWSPKQGQNVFLNYDTRTREPSMNELQPFTDNSDPLNVYVGNPNLEPEYSHNMSLNYHFFDQFTFVNFFAFLRAGYTDNKIARSRTIGQGFAQETTSINTDGDWTYSGNMDFGTPIRPLGMKVNLNYNGMYNRGLEFVNGEESTNRTLRNTVRTTLENRDKERFDLAVTASWTFNDVKYSINERQNQNYMNSSYEVRGSLYLGETWEISSSLDYRMYSQEAFGDARNIPLWEASITKSLIGQRADLQLVALDLLDRNEGINISNNGTTLREERINSLGRYVMLKFIYRLSGSGRDKGPQAIHIMG